MTLEHKFFPTALVSETEDRVQCWLCVSLRKSPFFSLRLFLPLKNERVELAIFLIVTGDNDGAKKMACVFKSADFQFTEDLLIPILSQVQVLDVPLDRDPKTNRT